MQKFLLTLLSASLFLTGGGFPHQQAQKACRVVTGITVQYEGNDEAYECRYTSEEKMNRVLLYLRSLEAWDVATENIGNDDRYRICLYFSDGSTKLYEQLSYYCLSENNGPWMEIDPERAIRLPLLLAVIPGDVTEP